MGFSIGLGPNEGSGNQLMWSHGSCDHNNRHFVFCFLVNADFVGKTCSQHLWNIVVSIYFWFCLQSKVSRKGRWSLPRMFFVAFVQFVSKLFFPKMYWDFNGWACNPVPGPQDAQRRVAIIVTRRVHAVVKSNSQVVLAHNLRYHYRWITLLGDYVHEGF